MDDAPGGTLSPRIPGGARARRLPHDGGHARAGGPGDPPTGGPHRRGRGDHLQRHPGRPAGDGDGPVGGRGRRPAIPPPAAGAERLRAPA